jgi:hypothetical protein
MFASLCQLCARAFCDALSIPAGIMAGLVSAIHALLIGRHNVDARDQRASNWEGDPTISQTALVARTSQSKGIAAR